MLSKDKKNPASSLKREFFVVKKDVFYLTSSKLNRIDVQIDMEICCKYVADI